MMSLALAFAPSNTTPFRCFQIIQQTSVHFVAKIFFLFLGSWMEDHHPASSEFWFGKECCWSHLRRKKVQTCRTTTQPRSKWSIVSNTWSHNAQALRWSIPRRCRRSAVQHLFRQASHRNFLHFVGALEVQIRSCPSNSVLPSNIARYADLTVNFLESVHFQCSSSFPSHKLNSATQSHRNNSSWIPSAERLGFMPRKLVQKLTKKKTS